MKQVFVAAILAVSTLAAAPATALAGIDVRKGGSSWATIEDDGTVRIDGSSVGKIESDGTLRKSGSSIGMIESGGTIRKGGSSWGSASSCCGDFGSKRTVAALLAFFSGDFF